MPIPRRIPRELKWSLASAAIIITLFALRIFEPLELMTHDARFVIRGYQLLSQESDVIVVGITQQCIEKLGEPPWPRSVYAEAIDQLSAAGATLIALDVCFQSPVDEAEDQLLVEAAERSQNLVLPVFCPIALKFYEKGPFRRVDELRENIPGLTRAAVGLGHINLPPSTDGRRRFAPLALEYHGNIYYNLGLESAFHYLRLTAERAGKPTQDWSAITANIPVTEDGEFMINYSGQHATLDLYPFHWVLEGKIPQDRIRDRLVLIGQTALGRVNADVIPTPLGEMYGVFAQAAIIDNVLTRNFLIRQRLLPAMLMILLLSVTSAFAFSRLPWAMSPLGWVLATFLVCYAAVFVFNTNGYIVQVVPALVVLAANFVFALVVGLRESWATVAHQEFELAHIFESSRLATERLRPENAPQTLVNLVGETIGCRLVTLSLCDRDGFWFWSGESDKDRRAGKALDVDAVRGFEQESTTLFGDRTTAYFSSNPTNEADLAGIAPGLSSFLSTPLVVQSQTTGWLNFYDKRPTLVSPTDEFTEDDMRLIAVLAQQTALTLDNITLIQDLDGKNRALSDALEQLKAAQDELVQQEKLSTVGKMASMIIHDIRGPLTALMGFGELMKGRSLPEDESTEYGNFIVQETDRVNQMVQEILDFTRGTKSLNMETLDADTVVLELSARIADEMRDSKVEVKTNVDPDAAFRCDREKILRVLLNLCRNAAEAMDQEGLINIEGHRRDDTVEFIVTDNGPGIPGDLIDRIFDPFVTAGKQKGTGLGLAIVQKIVQDHGGNIRVESQVGLGATFTIHFPVEGPPERDTAADDASAADVET